MSLFIVSAKSRYHPYGPYNSSRRPTFLDKGFCRSLHSKCLEEGVEHVEGKSPPPRRIVDPDDWDLEEGVVLTPGQQKCLETAIEMDALGAPFQLYVGGFAGAGKSMVCRMLTEQLRRRYHFHDAVRVTAPVGIAALNVGGETIHKLLKLMPDKTLNRLSETEVFLLHEKLRRLKVLIIDEVSLLSVVLLTQIDVRLREVFGNDLVFGGVSIVAFGDLLQLAAVSDVREKDRNGVAHTIPVSVYDALPAKWRALRDAYTPHPHKDLWGLFKIVELEENMRTKDPEEARMLAEIRQGVESKKTVDWLTSNCQMDGDKPADLFREMALLRHENPSGEYIILAVENMRVNQLNDWFAEQHAAIVIPPLDVDDGNCNYRRTGVKRTLKLVLGCRVMVTDNHSDQSIANGVMGVLLEVTSDTVFMERSDNGQRIALKRFPYQDREKKGPVWYQFPIAMAEAITVNKSQGMTFDGLVVDSEKMGTIGSSFYTSLSRARFLRNVRITNVRSLRYRAVRGGATALDSMRRRTTRTHLSFLPYSVYKK